MKRRIKPMITLAFPYIVAIFFPIIAVIFLSVTVVADYHEGIVAEKKKNIEIAFDNLADRLESVENLAYMIGCNDTVYEYVYRNLLGKGNTWLDSDKISDLLSDCNVNNDVEIMYLYDAIQNRIITTSEVMSNPMQYFQYKYQPENYTKEMWEEKLRTFAQNAGYSPSMNVMIGETDMQVIEYCVAVPFEVKGDSRAYLIIVMDIEALLGDILNLVGEAGELYLYRGKEKLIYSSGDQYAGIMTTSREVALQELEGEKGLYGAVLQSPDHYWRLQVYIPELVPMDMNDSEIMFVWTLMIVTILISVMVCVYFTFKNHREIGSLLHNFSDIDALDEDSLRTGEAFTYRYINEYIERVIDENKSFKHSLSKMEVSHKYQILDKLIRNTYENREEINALLATGELDIWTGRSVVLCLKYNSLYYRMNISEDVSVKDFVNELLRKLIDERMEVFEISSRETICILSAQNEQMETHIQNIIANLMVEIVYGYGIDIYVGAGESVDSIYQIHDSYTQAREVIKYREMSGANIYLYSEMKKLKNVYYFSKEMEERFCNYIILGKYEDAKAIAGKVYTDNFENDSIKLSASAVGEIKERFRNALLLLAEKFDLPVEEESSAMGGLLERFDREQDVHGIFRNIYEGIDILTESIMRKNKNTGSGRSGSAKKIMEFIDANYCDNMLSVKMIASELGLHEDYISKLFKKEYGDNLSAVIEHRRIAKACELLKTTEMKVADIAETVGYNNVGIFRKAFKRITGMAPSEYTG